MINNKKVSASVPDNRVLEELLLLLAELIPSTVTSSTSGFSPCVYRPFPQFLKIILIFFQRFFFGSPLLLVQHGIWQILYQLSIWVIDISQYICYADFRGGSTGG